MSSTDHPAGETRRPSPLGVRLLLTGIAGVAAFSLAALFADWPAGLFARILVDEPWATEGDTGAYIGLLFAILSAITVAWMLLLAWTVTGPLVAGVRGAWAAAAGSVGTWFVLDSLASLARGFPVNVALNVAIVVLCFVPGFWLTRPRAGLYRGDRAATPTP